MPRPLSALSSPLLTAWQWCRRSSHLSILATIFSMGFTISAWGEEDGLDLVCCCDSSQLTGTSCSIALAKDCKNVAENESQCNQHRDVQMTYSDNQSEDHYSDHTIANRAPSSQTGPEQAPPPPTNDSIITCPDGRKKKEVFTITTKADGTEIKELTTICEKDYSDEQLNEEIQKKKESLPGGQSSDGKVTNEVNQITPRVLTCDDRLKDSFEIDISDIKNKQYTTAGATDDEGKKKTIIKAEYRGSAAFQNCQTLTKTKWSDLVHTTNADTIANSFYNQGWEEAKKDAMREISAKLQTVKDISKQCDQEKMKRAVSSLINQINSAQSNLQDLAIKIDKCIGVIPAMDYVKYDDKELIVPQNNMGVVESVSSDKKIACTTTGVEVQDYPACKAIVIAYEAANAGEAVMGVVQTYQTQQTVSDNYYEYEKDAGDPKAALKAQLNSTKNNRTISDTRTGFYATKMATMAGMISSIPDYDDLLKKCEDRFGSSYESPVAKDAYRQAGFVQQLKQAVNAIKNSSGLSGHTGGTEEIFDKNGNDRDAGFCGNAIYQTEFNLIQNQRAKDAAIQAAVQAGIDMTKYGLSSALLRDQIRRIKHAMDDIDDYQPANYSVKLTDAQVKYCQQHPNADGCRNKYYLPNESKLADNTITLQAGGSNTTDPSTDYDDTYGARNIASGTQSVNSMGDPVIPETFSNDFESAPPPPGSTQLVQGKGGGDTGAAAGGGGSAAVPSGDNKKDGNNNGGYYKPQSINYTAGGASVGYTGGRIKNSKEKSNNPLAGLLNKEGAADNSNTISTFRDLASISKKDDDLFQKISARYETAMKQKRLIEYQAVDKKTKSGQKNNRKK